MTTLTKRTTIYLEQELHQALRMKSAETNHSISELINEMVREHLREDVEDLQTFRNRDAEPTISYQTLLEDLRKHGKV